MENIICPQFSALVRLGQFIIYKVSGKQRKGEAKKEREPKEFCRISEESGRKFSWEGERRPSRDEIRLHKSRTERDILDAFDIPLDGENIFISQNERMSFLRYSGQSQSHREDLVLPQGLRFTESDGWKGSLMKDIYDSYEILPFQSYWDYVINDKQISKFSLRSQYNKNQFHAIENKSREDTIEELKKYAIKLNDLETKIDTPIKSEIDNLDTSTIKENQDRIKYKIVEYDVPTFGNVICYGTITSDEISPTDRLDCGKVNFNEEDKNLTVGTSVLTDLLSPPANLNSFREIDFIRENNYQMNGTNDSQTFVHFLNETSLIFQDLFSNFKSALDKGDEVTACDNFEGIEDTIGETAHSRILGILDETFISESESELKESRKIRKQKNKKKRKQLKLASKGFGSLSKNCSKKGGARNLKRLKSKVPDNVETCVPLNEEIINQSNIAEINKNYENFEMIEEIDNQCSDLGLIGFSVLLNQNELDCNESVNAIQLDDPPNMICETVHDIAFHMEPIGEMENTYIMGQMSVSFEVNNRISSDYYNIPSKDGNTTTFLCTSTVNTIEKIKCKQKYFFESIRHVKEQLDLIGKTFSDQLSHYSYELIKSYRDEEKSERFSQLLCIVRKFKIADYFIKALQHNCCRCVMPSPECLECLGRLLADISKCTERFQKSQSLIRVEEEILNCKRQISKDETYDFFLDMFQCIDSASPRQINSSGPFRRMSEPCLIK